MSHDLAEIIVKALEENPKETLDILGRSLALVAHDVGNVIEFNCHLAKVTIEPFRINDASK